MKNPFLIALILCVTILLVSCDGNRIFEENKAIGGETWNASDKITFEMDIADTVSLCNIYINLRHRADYAYRNLFLFITTKRPDGKSSVDTVECMLQDGEGNWLGKGSGSLRDNRLFFRSGVRFPVTGRYQFIFEQAMRDQALKHVTDIGLRIEKQ